MVSGRELCPPIACATAPGRIDGERPRPDAFREEITVATIQELVGTRVKRSSASDEPNPAARDHVIKSIYYDVEFGKWSGWSEGPSSGEHLTAKSESELRRKIMSLT